MTRLSVQEVAWCQVDAADGSVQDRLFTNSCLIVKQEKSNINFVYLKTMKLFLPGFEPGTYRVLAERDNHYTTETFQLEHNPRRLSNARQIRKGGWHPDTSKDFSQLEFEFNIHTVYALNCER